MSDTPEAIKIAKILLDADDETTDEKIAELGEKTSSYTELAPRFVDLNYRLEAFNEYGIAPDLSLTTSACR